MFPDPLWITLRVVFIVSALLLSVKVSDVACWPFCSEEEVQIESRSAP